MLNLKIKSMVNRILDAVCVTSNSEVSVFYSARKKSSFQVKNGSIRESALPPDARENDGRVKVGTTAVLFELENATGKCCFIDDPSRNHKNPNVGFSYGKEGPKLEFKKSLHHVCDPRIDNQEGSRHLQYRILAEELCAFANSKDEGELIVGVDDNGRITENGLNLEVKDTQKEESYLRNYFGQTLSVNFSSKLNFKWEYPNGKLVLRIQSPKWLGDVLLLCGMELYLRSGSNTMRLKGTDMIHFIRNNAITA